MNKTLALVAALAVLSSPVQAPACTTAATRNLAHVGPIIVKSYDWDNSDGYVVVNQVHLLKTAIGVPDPLTWVSSYQSVTFNQWGMNMPMGGMNEKGLVVEIMKVGDFKADRSAAEDYPLASKQGKKRAINQVQWVQYILDKADGLNAAVKLAKSVYASPEFRIGGKNYYQKLFDIDPVHYLVCNAHGTCRVFEYRDHRLLISRDHAWTKAMPKKNYPSGELPFGPDSVSPHPATVDLPRVPVLANNFAASDADCLDKYLALPQGTACVKGENTSPEQQACRAACGKITDRVKDSAKSTRRFIMATAKAEAAPDMKHAKTAAGYGFHTMAKEVCNDSTRWQIVYLPKLKRAYWKAIDPDKNPDKCKGLHKGHGTVSLKHEKTLAHSCRELKNTRVWDLDGKLTGHAYNLIDYPSLRYPTLTKINSQALVNNFAHASRYHASTAEYLSKGNGLSMAEMTAYRCKLFD